MTRHYRLETTRHAPAISFGQELNPQQLAAVTSMGGPALVIAGAGSGKTRTLTYRVAWLLSSGVRPRDILLLTFTNKAAREMLERVATLVPGAADGIWGGTFHSIGNRILRRHAERIGFRQGFSILDRDDSEELIEAAVAHEGLAGPDRRFPKGEVLAELFSLATNTGASLREVLATRYHYFVPVAAQIERAQAAYEARKKQVNAMDFDDLLTKTLELFLTCPDVEQSSQFEHVLVDEYQDTNRLQAALVERFALHSGNIMVVGDDAQSIYSWRGADFENILRFPRQHPDAVVYKIETNYRSVPAVLGLANAAIRGNARQFEKTLAAVRPASETRPALVPLATSRDQAQFVAQRVLEMHHEEGIPLEEIAVLYRAHFHSLEIQLAFTQRKIPYSITSGLRFFEQAHVKDAAAFLKLAVNPSDELAFKRAARLLPGIGAKSADALWLKVSALLGGEPRFRDMLAIKPPPKAAKGWAQLVHTLCELRPQGKPPGPAEMVATVLFAIYDETMRQKFANYEARREDLDMLADFAGQFETTEDFLAQLSLLGAVETAGTVGPVERERVTLSTIHQAKGLEWSVVFLIWLAEGMFPHARSAENPAGLEEERRLFYVGITRCKDELYLTYPCLRSGGGFGESVFRASRFLGEIPTDLIEEWTVDPGQAPGEEPF